MSAPEDNPDIAIIGLSCRFPGARNAAEFWHNLAGGVESITRFSDEELAWSGVLPEHLAAPNYVKAAPVLDDPGGFDAAFFGFTPNEARTMDPQHRILLELAFEALEDAGCDPARYPGRIGVFAGAAMNTYFMQAGLQRQFAEEYIPTLIVNDKDFLSTRLSYKLNLKGPSVTLQTACSTSLVAIHFARQSLLTEEIDIALAGAISVRAPHRAGYLADAGGVASPSGHVRAFDAGADGTVFGSGGGVVVLKRLRDALADGDTIHAVIKGSAINNDGADKAGYTAPSVNSQAEAVIEALANADVEADSIGYLEAHGSGTPVGDPIEILALTKAFRASTERSGFCAIGSVKTNVGHLDAAAGMAGLIKTVLALRHRQIPASLHFAAPNPEIDFASSPFFVNTKLTPWDSGRGPRRAGIMSTGMGGTNAHVVLEEAPEVAPEKESSQPQLLVFSARTEPALAAAADRFREFLELHSVVSLDDAAFTLQVGRRAMEHRRFVVAADRAAATASLAAKPGRLNVGRVPGGDAASVILLLPGVGDHYVGMGRELDAAFPAFRQAVDDCAEILRPRLGLDIRDVLYPPNRAWNSASKARGIDLKKMLGGEAAPPEDEDTRRLNQATCLQSALFTIEYALARLWMSLGVMPRAIVGHSMGEYVAACLAGTFSLEDALHLIVRRTQLVEPLPPARMLAVSLAESDLLPLLPKALSICLINGPSLCVVAGPPLEVEDFARALAARNVLSRPVKNTHAFHSRMLDPIVAAFEQEVRKVRRQAPRIPFISNVTGQWITEAEAIDPAYWARHLNHPARFNDALRTMWQMENAVLLEAGPGKTLGVLAMQHPDKQAQANPAAIASLRHDYENQPDVELLLHSAGRLWLAGVEMRWEALPGATPRQKISLPTYAFEHQNYWLDGAAPSVRGKSSPEVSAKSGIDDWFYVPSWERTPFPKGFRHPSDAEGILWLIISDRPEHATAFRKCLEPTGAMVQFVRLPARPDSYLELFREIKREATKSIHIVHLGCLTTDGGQDFGFHSLLSIAQAIGDANISIPVRIGIISNQIHEVTGDEDLHPEMATVLGPCGVIPKEFPNVRCFNVDLPGETVLDDAAAGILAEFAQPDGGEVIAYRGRYRWKKTYLPTSLPAAASPPARLRHRGVYLITGGTGGLGLTMARYLAETCQARLVLTKRSAFPAKSEWAKLRASGNAPASVLKVIDTLAEIEGLGAEVEVMAADVAEREQMRGVLDETRRKFGSLDGIIHAAGVVRAGVIQAATREAASAVLSPKVQGTLVLHELLRHIQIDFVVLFSSMASIASPFAHASYSAANAFLDAFAAYSRSHRKYHTLSIDWPVWKEIGSVANLETFMGVEKWKEEALKKAILTRDGLEVFARALDSGFSQLVVSPERLDHVLAQAREPLDSSPAPTGARVSSSTAILRRAANAEADQPTDEVEEMIAGIWSAVFGLPQIGIHEEFADLGGHSLLALQILTKMQAAYHVPLTLREFFEAPTIAQLSSLVRDKLIMDIASLTDDEVRQLISNGSAQHDK